MRITRDEDVKFVIEAKAQELKFLLYAAKSMRCESEDWKCPYIIGDRCDDECSLMIVKMENALGIEGKDNRSPGDC